MPLEKTGVNMKRNILKALSLLVSLSILCSCGSTTDKNDKSDADNSYVYTAEKTKLQLGGNEWLMADCFTGTEVYCLLQKNREEMQNIVRHYSIADGTEEDIILELGQGQSAYDFEQIQDGYICLSYDEDWEYHLSKLDRQGELQSSINISEYMDGQELFADMSDICMDAEGRIYLLFGKYLYIFDEKIIFQGKVSLEGEPRGLLHLQTGEVAVAFSMREKDAGYKTEIYTVNAQKGTLGKRLFKEKLDVYLGNEAENRIYGFDLSTLYEIEEEKGKIVPLCSWNEINVNGSQVVDIHCGLEEKYALVHLFDDRELQVVSIKQVPASQVKEKTEIVLAATYDPHHVLERILIDFNDSNNEVHVTLKTYLTGDIVDVTYQEEVDAQNKFHMDVLSGKCEADLFYLKDNNFYTYAEYGILEDLTPYFEKSRSVQISDIFEPITKSCSVDGELVGIPQGCSILTLCGKGSDFQEKSGWTLEEMISYGKRKEESSLVTAFSGSGLLPICLSYGGGPFIDWDTNSCDFESDIFKELLALLKRQQDYQIDIEGSLGHQILSGQALTAFTYLDDFTDVQEYRTMFNDDMVVLGYPTKEGENGNILDYSGIYSINTNSDQKAAAWQLIEYLLNTEAEEIFPVNKKKFADLARKEIGNEDIYEKYNEKVFYSDWSYDVRPVDEGDVALVEEMLQNGIAMFYFTPRDYQVLDIVQEEAEAYFQGQKTLDEVCTIIQSRAQLYIEENY